MAEIERHDASSVYHKLTLGDLAEHVPQINWHVYLQVSYYVCLFTLKNRNKKKNNFPVFSESFRSRY